MSSTPSSPSIIIFFFLFLCTFPPPHFSLLFFLFVIAIILSFPPYGTLNLLFLLVGLIGLPVVAHIQKAFLYLLCRAGPSCRHQHFSSFSLLEMTICHANSALSASGLTFYDCPVPLLVHQDNLSLSSYQHFLCVALRH